MNTLFLFSNFAHTLGGIPHFNRLLVRAVRESASSAHDRIRVLALHDTEPSVAAGSSEGFGGHRAAFIRAAVEAGYQSNHVVFGHAHLAPLAWAMPHANKCLIAHGIEVWNPLSLWRASGLRRMQQVWAVSRYTRDHLMLWSGIPRDHFQVLSNTLAPEAPVPEMTRHQLNLPDGPVILTVSRLDSRERYKNIDRLLDALVGLPEAFLVLVGEGSDRLRLEKRAKRNNVETRVRFTGAINDELLGAYYRSCDLFALPSTREGFGIVYLEAMMAGKTCVGAAAGGTPEVIQDGVTGRIVRPDDTDDLQAALLALLKDSSLRRTMGAAGHARFEQQFAYPRFCQRVRELMASMRDEPIAAQRLSA